MLPHTLTHMPSHTPTHTHTHTLLPYCTNRLLESIVPIDMFVVEFEAKAVPSSSLDPLSCQDISGYQVLHDACLAVLEHDVTLVLKLEASFCLG